MSFRWNPGDDRRYALGWHDPSGEEVRTEHGANLLAAFGLPLFPLVPTRGGAETTGFDSQADPPTFTWPLWDKWYTADSLRSLLALRQFGKLGLDRAGVTPLAVAEVYRVRKIEVGRPPLSKLNLTPSVVV
jgi:hypothetical protein